ncbi:MAG: hypothetical protein JWN02_2332 [Acidobacteria bacterium]|nr:hypothetical protein [Acidobacteriota bacterium]
MPLIRCPKCGQAYDVPGVIAVRLPNSIATCHCGEWLSGSKAAVLARLLNPEQIREIDLQPYRVDLPSDELPPFEPSRVEPATPLVRPADTSTVRTPAPMAPAAPSEAMSGRAVLVCISGSLIGQEFEIPPAGLVVGREGHVRVLDEYLSRRHFEVVPEGDGSVRVRDLGSRNGTFLNAQPAQNAAVQAGDEISAGINRFRIERR